MFMMSMMGVHLTRHFTSGVILILDRLKIPVYLAVTKRVRRMFKFMTHDETIFRRKNLTIGELQEFINPCLMRGLKIYRANRMWRFVIT
jgi:hypothetical protein